MDVKRARRVLDIIGGIEAVIAIVGLIFARQLILLWSFLLLTAAESWTGWRRNAGWQVPSTPSLRSTTPAREAASRIADAVASSQRCVGGRGKTT